MKVLLSGYYGFGNLGDEALLAGLVGALDRCGHEVTVLSADTRATERLHGVRARNRYLSLVPAVAASDWVVSGGGGLLQDRTSSRSLRYYLSVLQLARLMGKRRLVYGQSVGPLSDQGARSVAHALRDTPVAVRDERSLAVLAELGVEAHLVADPALALTPQAAQPDSESSVLLIPRAGEPTVTSGLIDLARRLVGAGTPVSVLAFHKAQDEPEVAALTRSVPGVRLRQADSPQGALACLAQARHVVSARLHGLILAALSGRAQSGIVYDPKVAAFLSEVGLALHEVPLDVDRLLADVAAHTTADASRVAGLVGRARAGLDWLNAQLASI